MAALNLVQTIVNASNPEADFGNAAIATDEGYAIGLHVTDDPARLVKALSADMPLTALHRERFMDMGPGLYVSAVPQLWMARARKKWDFLRGLTPSERMRLAEALLEHGHLHESGYLSANEIEVAKRDIRNFLRTGSGEFIVHLAGQPYNIRFWMPEFLGPLGIEPGPRPVVLRVHFIGRYAQLSQVPTELEYDELREGDLDGIFLKGGFVGDPQLVIWRNEAVLYVEEEP